VCAVCVTKCLYFPWTAWGACCRNCPASMVNRCAWQFAEMLAYLPQHLLCCLLLHDIIKGTEATAEVVASDHAASVLGQSSGHTGVEHAPGPAHAPGVTAAADTAAAGAETAMHTPRTAPAASLTGIPCRQTLHTGLELVMTPPLQPHTAHPEPYCQSAPVRGTTGPG
jgi:hypothetical protein